MALEEGPDSASPLDPMTVPRARGWFRQAVLGSAGAYAEALLAAIFVNLLALAIPLFVIVIFDQIVQFNAVDLIWRLGAAVAVVIGLDFLLRMLRSHFAESAGAAAMARIEDRLFQRMVSVKLADSGDADKKLAAVADALKDLRGMMTAAPVLVLVDLPFIVLFIGACYFVGGPVALIPLVAVPTVLFVSLILQLLLRAQLSGAQGSVRQRLHIADEALNGLETVKSLGAEVALQRLWEDVTTSMHRETRRMRGVAAWITNLTSVAGKLVLVATIAYGAFLVIGGALSIGGLVAVALLAMAALAPLDRLAAVLVDYQRGRAALDAIDALMRVPVERPDGVAFAGSDTVAGRIAFQDVHFRYPGQPNPVLEGVTFQIEPGEKVGMIGRIGSGKTTILRLITGLYAPETGLVAVDGMDVSQFDPTDLRANFGVVSQDVQLFAGTLEENICLAGPTVEDEAVQRAAQIAGVDTIAEKHPLGYAMPVGARGQALSVGERQAVAVARALLPDPPVLLLDEPTAALDNTSEGRLRARLANVTGSKTLLLVTNRASMLSMVDRLIVVDKGRIVADGAKQEVLEGLQGGLIQTLQVSE